LLQGGASSGGLGRGVEDALLHWVETSYSGEKGQQHSSAGQGDDGRNANLRLKWSNKIPTGSSSWNGAAIPTYLKSSFLNNGLATRGLTIRQTDHLPSGFSEKFLREENSQGASARTEEFSARGEGIDFQFLDGEMPDIGLFSSSPMANSLEDVFHSRPHSPDTESTEYSQERHRSRQQHNLLKTSSTTFLPDLVDQEEGRSTSGQEATSLCRVHMSPIHDYHNFGDSTNPAQNFPESSISRSDSILVNDIFESMINKMGVAQRNGIPPPAPPHLAEIVTHPDFTLVSSFLAAMTEKLTEAEGAEHEQTFMNEPTFLDELRDIVIPDIEELFSLYNEKQPGLGELFGTSEFLRDLMEPGEADGSGGTKFRSPGKATFQRAPSQEVYRQLKELCAQKIQDVRKLREHIAEMTLELNTLMNPTIHAGSVRVLDQMVSMDEKLASHIKYFQDAVNKYGQQLFAAQAQRHHDEPVQSSSRISGKRERSLKSSSSMQSLVGMASPKVSQMRAMVERPCVSDPSTRQDLGEDAQITELGTSILKRWMYAHFEHPYPTPTEKRELMRRTRCTLKQVSDWFVNNRVRLWRKLIMAMCGDEEDEEEPSAKKCRGSGKSFKKECKIASVDDAIKTIPVLECMESPLEIEDAPNSKSN